MSKGSRRHRSKEGEWPIQGSNLERPIADCAGMGRADEAHQALCLPPLECKFCEGWGLVLGAPTESWVSSEGLEHSRHSRNVYHTYSI